MTEKSFFSKFYARMICKVLRSLDFFFLFQKINLFYKRKKIFFCVFLVPMSRVICRGESIALGQSSFFKKYEREILEFFRRS